MTSPRWHSRTAPSSVSATTIVSSLLTVQTSGRGFTDLTADIARFASDAGAREGVVTLFIRHTSASLTIQENADPSVLRDLTTALDRLAPEHAGWSHDTEGPDDMPAHIKTHAERDVAAGSGARGQTGARNLAGDLPDRASRAAAPPRGRAAVHRRRLKAKPAAERSAAGLSDRSCRAALAARRTLSWS
jgi:secondary thiamine-phosphate synthase enzyme